MKGFDAEFRDLDQYIRVITDRIWEGRRIDDIRRYYSEDCAVETPASVSIGIDPVIDGTRATLVAFSDRRLLAEDVIISGDDDCGFLSSHRIFSPMTHTGPGVFGPPSGRAVYARTVADCVCVNNRIVHEWLVRDQAAIARQIGRHERDVAQDWLDQRGKWNKPAMPPAPLGYLSFVSTEEPAAAYADVLRRLWTAADVHGLTGTHDVNAVAALPGGTAAAGLPAIQDFWRSMTNAFTEAHFEVEHLVINPRPGRSTALAMRWRVQAQHGGSGRYGLATDRAVEVMGISHAEIEASLVVREWHLIDDVAIWMQLLNPRV